MKLAESLQERADLNRKIEELKQRLENNCLVQEGERPAEDPEELLRVYMMGRRVMTERMPELLKFLG